MVQKLPDDKLEETNEMIEKEEKDIVVKKQSFIQDTVKSITGKKKMEDLVEDFTKEVSLVTQGLWNDQKKIRDNIEDITMEQSLWEKKEEDARKALVSEVEILNQKIRGLEDKVSKLEGKNKKTKKSNGLLFQISLLVFVLAGAWVLVTIINAFAR